MKKISLFLSVVLLFAGCVTNPLTGKSTMAFTDNSELFPASFAQYDEVIQGSALVSGTADSAMVTRVGERLAAAAQIWLESENSARYLDEYRWEYNLIEEDTVNAWCMPGGKIAVYTGILPVTESEEGLAVVLGHEIAHALLNHGQQRMSADILQQAGAVGVSIGAQAAGVSAETQAMAEAAYDAGSRIGGTLRFSREHESEADHYGLILMAIAGYNPDEAVPFWERMAALGGGGTPEFLSTHPSDATRINQLKGWISEAKQKAAELGTS